MALDLVKEKWSNAVAAVIIRALKDEGEPACRWSSVGARKGFLFVCRREVSSPPVAMEVLDVEPDDWPRSLTSAIGGTIKTRWNGR